MKAPHSWTHGPRGSECWRCGCRVHQATAAKPCPEAPPYVTDEEQRAADRERMRQRRAAMTVEERRAEWLRHQRARRARLRAARSEAA